MFKSIRLFLAFFSIPALFVSCGSKQDVPIDTSDEVAANAAIDSQKISAQNVFNAITERSVIIDLIQKSGAEYNPTILNNPDDASKYSLESSRAINLGVYGADLNVTGLYEQTQESILFFKCVSSISKSLGISNCFDERMGDRMQANKNNRDSTLEIISQSFKNADSYLKSNGRPGTSSLIVAGAWIEGFYLACATASETKNELIIKEIYSQKESLKYLIELLESSKLPEETTYLLPDLKELKMKMDANSDNNFKLGQLTEVFKSINSLRSKVISTK